MAPFGTTLAVASFLGRSAEASLRGTGADTRRLEDAEHETVDSLNSNTSADLSVVARGGYHLKCVDTPGWTNGWRDCKSEDLGDDRKNCKPRRGWTCEGYVAKGWCKNDRCLRPWEINGVYACGPSLGSPELNCCACGKAAERFTVTCAHEGCGGAHKPQNSCQCTRDCNKYNNCCKDYQQVCESTPAPSPGPPASCGFYGCGGAYKPGNACQCNSECEKYNNCCDDYWQQCGELPPVVTYESYHGRNAYAPNGATNIDTDQTAPTGYSVEQCEDRCTQDRECSCVTYEPRRGNAGNAETASRAAGSMPTTMTCT